MIPRRAAAARGFSLIEVMVSIAVLAIGLTATFPLVSYSVQRAANARRETLAQQIGVEVLEHLRTETRFDTLGASAPDLNGGGTVDGFWRREVLPHDNGAALAGSGTLANGQPIPGCLEDNAAATDFGGGAVVGPFWMTRGGEVFAVCYSVGINGPNPCPSDTCQVRALVKVLWRSAGTVVARRVPGRLTGTGIPGPTAPGT